MKRKRKWDNKEWNKIKINPRKKKMAKKQSKRREFESKKKE